MARVKFKAEVHGHVDTDDYAVPSDGNLSLQIKDDLIEAIESSLPFEIVVKVTGTGKIHDTNNSNYD